MSIKFDALFDFAVDSSKDEASTGLTLPITPDEGVLEIGELNSFGDHAFDANQFQLVTPLSDTISPQELIGQVDDVMGSPLFDAPLENPDEWASLFGPAPPSEAPELHKELDGSAVEETIAGVPPNSTEVTEYSSKSRVSKKRRSTPLSKLSSEAVAAVGKVVLTEISTDIDAKKDDLGLTIYNRKPRSLPLSPVVVDEEVEGSVASKRARNTEAARRSRARKMERMIQLEELVRDLAEKNAQLKSDLEAYRECFGELPSKM